MSYTRYIYQYVLHLGAAAALAVAALTTSATPARASDDALFKFLLGATAVAIIVSAASQPQAKSKQPRRDPRALPAHCRETLSIRGRHVTAYNAACLRDAGVRNLPQHCVETLRTNRGHRQLYRARCLEQAGFYAATDTSRNAQQRQVLPRQCSTQYTYRGQRHHGYSASCLQRAGVRNMPSSCLVRGTDGRIYSATCLRDHGVARR